MPFDLPTPFSLPEAANSAPVTYYLPLPSYRIHFASGPCGGGKTFATARYIADEIRSRSKGTGRPLLYVSPSINLLNEFATTLTSLGITDYRIISSETEECVTKELIKHFKSIDNLSLVTLCTHTAFLNLPYFHDRDRWTIFIDEAPQIDDYFYFPVSLSQSADLLDKWFEVKQFNDKVSKVTFRSENELDRLLKIDDVTINPFKKLFQKCRSPSYDIFTESASYDRIVNQRLISDASKHNTVHFVALLRPEALRDTTILGANFEASMLYDHLKRNHCRLVEAEKITSRLRYTEYPKTVGDRAIIRYCLEDQVYSKWFRTQLDVTGKPIKEAIDATVLTHIGDRRFLALLNNDDKGPLRDANNVTVLPGSVGGLNCYDDHDCLVFIAALNRTPIHLRMLGYLGFSKDSIRQSTLIEQVHQSVMRTSLRKPDAIEPVEIIVADRVTAHAVGKMIGCKKIEKIGNIEVQQSVNKLPPYTKPEKDLRCRYKKRRNALFGKKLGQQEIRPCYPLKKKGRTIHNEDTMCSIGAQDSRNNKHDKTSADAQHTPNEQRLLLTYHSTTYANTSDRHAIESYSPTELMKMFWFWSKVPVESKDELLLFNTATFEPIAEPTRYRTIANFKASFGLVLDFDNGKLSPEEFERIIWHEPGSLRKTAFIICNTFRRSPEQPNRFRVIMPFKRPALSIAEFQAVYDAVVRRLEENGYAADESGLDRACRSGVQSFYIPGINRAYPEMAFFRGYGFKRGEFESYAIDSSGYGVTRQSEKPFVGSSSSVANRTLAPSEREWIENTNQRLKSMTEGRNRPFWDFAVELRSLGLSWAQIEAVLNDVAGNDNKMKGKVRDIMESLKGYG